MHGMTIRTGRKRNLAAIRDDHGISREHERKQKIDYEARAAFRGGLLKVQGIPAEYAKSHLAGSSLGQLFLRHYVDKSDPGAISEAQYAAGDTWSRVVRRHAAIMGFKLSAPSPSFIMVSGTSGAGTEPDEETITRVRKQYRDCYDALMAATREHSANVSRVTYAVCVDDCPPGNLHAVDYGELRIGLNALKRVLA